MPTPPYREQVLRLREDAIVEAVNRLLVSKGYELMTVDEVAAEAGMAKASLYKHFTSKEELAAAAMVRLLERALAQVAALQLTARDARQPCSASNRCCAGRCRCSSTVRCRRCRRRTRA